MATRKKHKKKSDVYATALAASLVAALLVISALIFLAVGGCDTTLEDESIDKKVPSDSNSSVTERPADGSESYISSESSEYTESSESESSEVSTPPEKPVYSSYEERVGKAYDIDIEPYLKYIEPEDASPYLILVNIAHPVGKDYVPQNMVVSEYTRPGREGAKMVETAAMALKAFLDEGKLNGVKDVTITNAYRSYSYQNWLFNYYTEQEMTKDPSLTKEEAQALVRIYSMPPGCSEHQSGLTCDMHNIAETTQAFGKKPEAKWLAENCYRFGFILRYPEDKQDITGVKWEPWHFRFVGREAATQMHELNMCLEEYIDYIS